MLGSALILLAAIATGSSGQSGRVQPESAGKLLLDQSAYWRYHVQFGMDRIAPDLLGAAGEKVLGGKGMARLERMVKRWRRPPFAPKAGQKALGGLDWRDDAPF